MAHEPRQQPEMDPEYDPDILDSDDESKGEVRSAAPRAQPSLSQPVTSSSLLGRTLGDRYRFDELIGEGTFARVFRVYDRYRRVDLAAKVLRSDIAYEPAFLERFEREAVVLSKLQHPNIVRYYDIVDIENTIFTGIAEFSKE